MDKISIVIPVFNTPIRYFTACIESLQKQSYQDLEILLVDDGSNNGVEKICDQYAEKDERIQVFHQKNQGVSVARNNALKYITGRYLIFVDSDDEICEKDVFQKVISCMKDSGAECAAFGWLECGEKKDVMHYVAEEKTIKSAAEISAGIAGDNLLFGGGYLWNKVWDMSIFQNAEEIPYFDVELDTYEDKYWALEVLKKCKTVALLPDIFYKYNFVPTGLTKNDEFWENRIFNGLEAYERIINLVKDQPDAKEKALIFYNRELINNMFGASKIKKINKGHFQRMKQVYYMARKSGLLEWRYIKNLKQKIKYIILKWRLLIY